MKKCPKCGADVPEAELHCDCGYTFPRWEDSKPAPANDNVSDPSLKRDRILFVIMTISLVLTFVRQLFPALETPRPAVRVLWTLVELALAVGLIRFGTRVLKAIPQKTPGRGNWVFLFWLGLVSLLGMFVIQLAGGQRLAAPPRSQPSTESLPPELEQMTVRFEASLATFEKAGEEVANTRWTLTAQADPRQLRKLSREDLLEHLAKQRALLDALEQRIQLLSEPGLPAKFDRVFSMAEARGLTGGRKRPEFDLPPWNLLRQMFSADYELNKIAEKNWEEWRLRETLPPEAEQKPWQKEMLRLARESLAAKKQLDETN